MFSLTVSATCGLNLLHYQSTSHNIVNYYVEKQRWASMNWIAWTIHAIAILFYSILQSQIAYMCCFSNKQVCLASALWSKMKYIDNCTFSLFIVPTLCSVSLCEISLLLNGWSWMFVHTYIPPSRWLKLYIWNHHHVCHVAFCFVTK